MREKRVLVCIRGVTVLAVITVAAFLPQMSVCSSSRFGTYASATPANMLVCDNIGNPEYLDPHVDYDSFGNWISYNVYETLYTYEWDSSNTEPTVPLMASDYAVTADGLNYTFYLREGIRFHDGTPFNASCVKYNFERVLAIFDTWGPAWMLAEPILGGQAVEDAAYEFGAGSPEHTAAYNAWKNANDEGIGAIIVIDTYAVKIRLGYPYAPFLAAITHEVGAMMSPTWVEAHGGVVVGQHNDYVDQNTCGTGPYMVSFWEPDNVIALDLNPDYWRSSSVTVLFPHAGHIGQVVIRTNEDVDSRILNMKSNTTDITYWPISYADEIWNGVNGSNGDGTLKSSIPYLKLWCQQPKYETLFIGLNMNPYLNNSGGITRSPFVNKDLRVAISWAFDYDALIADWLNGLGQQAKGPIPYGMFGHRNDMFVPRYDIDSAVAYWNLAMAAGLNDIWANMSYVLTLYYSAGSTDREAACLILKNGIQNIIDNPYSADPEQELTIDVVPIEWSTYQYLSRQRQLPLYLFGYTPDYADPDMYAAAFVESTGFYADRIGLGTSEGWNATEVDGWITQAVQVIDPVSRQAYYNQIQDAIVDHAAYIWAYQAQSFHVENINCFGYQYNPMHDVYFFHYHKTGATTTTTGPILWPLSPLSIAVTAAACAVILVTLVTAWKRKDAMPPSIT